MVERFSAEAAAFARSPLHRDPARLARLVALARPRARRLMEARVGATSGVRAFVAEGRLVFERPGILLRAVRP